MKSILIQGTQDGLPLLQLDRTPLPAPQRYVNRVGRLGAASLKEIPEPSRRGLPPLPYGSASRAYAAKLAALMKSM